MKTLDSAQYWTQCRLNFPLKDINYILCNLKQTGINWSFAFYSIFICIIIFWKSPWKPEYTCEVQSRRNWTLFLASKLLSNRSDIQLTLSLRRVGGGLLQPPLSDFPSCRFCVFAKIAIWSVYPPFVQIPMYLWKKFSKVFCREKSWEVGWGLQQPPPPPPPALRGKGWQQN